MFFLFRVIFWLGLVLVLLPREPAAEKSTTHQLGASEAISAATAAVSDMSGFCTRQPAACEVGGHAAAFIGERAQGGARKVYEYLIEKKSDGKDITKDNTKTDNRPHDDVPTGSIGLPRDDAGQAGQNSDDTLTSADRSIEWRAPAPSDVTQQG